MRNIYKIFLTAMLVTISSFSLMAQNNFFTDVSESALRSPSFKREIIPQKYRTVSVNVDAIKSFLWALPSEKQVVNRKAAAIMELPMPNGVNAKFYVWESSIMEPGLAAKLPEMRTFAGQGVDDPYATVRFDFNPYFGFHAQVLSVISGSYYIDPYAKGTISDYISYFRVDNNRNPAFTCTVVDDVQKATGNAQNLVAVGNCRGTQLYTYRLALACTGEYATAVCAPNPPTVAATAAAILTTVNRVDGVYETEVALRMVLVANNNDLIYLNGTTDPYTNNNGSTMLGQNQTNVDAVIGSANYDIGHVVSTGGGGVATLRAPCNPGLKARGVTGLTNPVGDNFDIDYVAHEMGHEWGGNHTFNSNLSSCGGGNRNGGTAYEVGSGSTIQAYAGICGADNTQPHSDPYFHSVSFDEISVFLENGGASCKVASPTGNSIPTITSMSSNGISIPVNTPFTLTGTATDTDGDALTYSWEEWDLGESTTYNGGANSLLAPLFKSKVPKTSGSRTFPDPAIIASNYATPTLASGLRGETLPAVARTLKFRLTVRDNRAGGGGVATGGSGCQTGFTTPFQINVAGTTPFTVTLPNGAETYAGNSTQTITWDVAGTDVAPINTANVKISLSTDGGLTFPTVIAASTANDGSEAVTIPNIASATARIKVEAIGNIYFDISNANFTITAATAGFGFTASAPTTVACSGPATAAVTLATTSTGGYVVPVNLSTTGTLPAGTTVAFGTNPVVPGNSSVVTLNGINTLPAGTYTINVQGASGTITQNTTITYIVSPGAAPVITTGPASQAVCAGTNVTFNVAATGTVSGYQWQLSTDNGGTFSNITGATASSYSIPAPVAGQNGYQYRVIVSSLCNAATSAAATLTVQATPAITGQPQNTTVCSGTNAGFTVTATGTNLTYQWKLSTDNGVTFNNVAGATANTIAVNAVTGVQNGYQYQVVVSGTCAPAVTSAAATLSVGDAAVIATPPSNTIACVGNNASFSVVATGSSLTYQWQVSTDGTTFNDITGQTGATLNLNAVTVLQNGNQYRVIVFSCTPTGITSAAAVLTVNTPVAIATQPLPFVTCLGTTATFSVAATGTALSYQWQYAATCSGTFTNIAGQNSATLTLNNVALSDGGSYRVVVTGACGPVTSSCVTLTVNSPVTISAQPVDFSICLPAPGGASFSVTAAGTGIAYQWQVSTDGTTFTNIAGATSATYTINPLLASQNGNKYRVALTGTCTTLLNSNVVSLTVNTPVSIVSQPVNTATCANSNVSFGISALGSTISYQWQVSINGGGFSNLSNTAPYSGVNTNQLTVTNANVNQNGNNYRVIVSGVPCGSVTSNVAKLTVNPLPAVVLTLASYANINPYIRTTLSTTVSPVGSYTYKWYKNSVLVPTITTPAFDVTVDDFGEYSVTVTDANGCSNSSNKVAVADVASNLLFIYPNPTTGKFQVRYYNAGGGSHIRSLLIYDSKGTIVYDKKYTLNGAYGKMEVDITEPGKGVYFIDLRDGAGKRLATGKVVLR